MSEQYDQESPSEVEEQSVDPVDPMEPDVASAAAGDADDVGEATEPIEPVPADEPVDEALVEATEGAAEGSAPAEVAVDDGTALRDGYACFKLKVGLPDDVERVAAVREAVGSWPALRLDANGAWTPEQAVEQITALEPFDLQLVEQPCATLEEMAEVRPHVGVPVAADESVASVAEVEAAAAADGGLDDPRLADRLGDLHVRTEVLRLTAYRGLSAIEQYGQPGPEGSLVKWLWSDTNQMLTQLAADVVGPEALTAGRPWAYELLRARGNSIEGGTTEILKNIVAERVLGLPKLR